MGTEVSARPSTAGSRGASSPSWMYARALWAGLSIITMWLAVLFVGIFGGDFISNSATNGLTRFPVVVLLLPFVLPATIVVARRGFTNAVDERHGASDEGTAVGRQATPERADPAGKA